MPRPSLSVLQHFPRSGNVADLTTKYVGITLRNPLIVGSAGITGRAELIARASDAGVGAVVMKSLGDRTWKSPRMGVLNRGKDLRSTTFYSVEGHAKLDERQYADEVAKAIATVDIPVIPSFTCLNDEDWVRRAKLLEEAGAPAMEADISCPHGAHVLIGCDSLSEVKRVTALLKSTVKVPVIPKLTPQAADPVAAALDAEAGGGDAVVMFNRFTGLDVDVRAQQPILHGGLAGHGGPWAIYYAMRWISMAYPKLKIPISSSGGVFDWEDAVKMLLVGATTVQTCTAVILKGYGVATEMVRGLERYMDEMGHRTVDEFRGLAARRLQGAATIDRTRQYLAKIDPYLCTECGECAKLCIYDAPNATADGPYAIDDGCAGCGLCAYLCPSGAITVGKVAAR